MRDVRWPVSAIPFLPAALCTARACRYLIYSDADFEVFRPARATRCTSGGEIWHGGWDLPLHAKFRPHRCNDKGDVCLLYTSDAADE